MRPCPAAPCWPAWKPGRARRTRSFGIYDTFDSEAGRQAHLDGPIAAALLARADELLAQPPRIDRIDLLASKLPH
jgi:quinol monooxygenase YgiN